MKLYIVTAERFAFATHRIESFHVRAWSLEEAKQKARDEGRCLASDTLTVREGRKNADGEYTEL